jgi:hypothetical protein
MTGASGGAPGVGGPPDGRDQPPPADVDKLFRPGNPTPTERNGRGNGGASSGEARRAAGQAGAAPDTDETDGTGDPLERAAARRLRQAVQRIQGARQGRQPPPAAGNRDAPPDADRRRDW